MLIKTGWQTKLAVVVSLIYDDKSVKKYELNLEDIVKLAYLKNGFRKEITGRVARIFTEEGHSGHIGHINSCEPCKNTGCYIIVDTSDYNNAGLNKIDVDTICEIELVQKSSNSDAICSPSGDSNISMFRLVGRQLQLTTDFGATWLKVLDLPEADIIVDPEYQSLADKIAALVPDCNNPAHKKEAVEGLVELFKNSMNADDPLQS